MEPDAYGEMPISCRTRARLDLGEYQRDDIEALLVPEDAEDGPSELSDNQDDYMQFIKGLAGERASPVSEFRQAVRCSCS